MPIVCSISGYLDCRQSPPHTVSVHLHHLHPSRSLPPHLHQHSYRAVEAHCKSDSPKGESPHIDEN